MDARRMITRETLQNDWLERIREAAGEGGEAAMIRTEAELQACRARALEGRSPGEDVWVFAYGSLIWNPAFHFVEHRLGRIFGYHRRFCLWTYLGRGTLDCPGLMLGLDRGGSCQGLFYRIEAGAVEEELTLIWRREMITAAYVPTWIEGRTAAGSVRALTFTINRLHQRYAGKLDEAAVVGALATAAGPIGRCCDYLFNTHDHLRDLQIHDPQLTRICRLVRAHPGCSDAARSDP